MQIRITEDQSKSMKRIAEKFSSVLSSKEIKKTAAFSLNETAKRAASAQRKNVRSHYTVSNKYLQRMMKVSHKANSTDGGMFASISYSTGTVPAMGFKHRNLNSKKTKYFAYNTKTRGVQIEIRKGKVTVIRHAFIKTVKSGHEGIWVHGYYQGGKLVHANIQTSKGKTRITEFKSASPFTMNTDADILDEVERMVERTLPGRFEALLNIKVNKLKGK